MFASIYRDQYDARCRHDERVDSDDRVISEVNCFCKQLVDVRRLVQLDTRPLAIGDFKMADARKAASKRKRKKEDDNEDSLIIRAKGQFLKLPMEGHNAGEAFSNDKGTERELYLGSQTADECYTWIDVSDFVSSSQLEFRMKG